MAAQIWWEQTRATGTHGREEQGGEDEDEGAEEREGKRMVVMNVSRCRYEVVRKAAQSLGWKLSEEGGDDFTSTGRCPKPDQAGAGGGRRRDRELLLRRSWNVWWTDKSVSMDRCMRLESFQRINHFPGMYRICRKNDLHRTLSRMARLFPLDFSFHPKTWLLPDDYADCRAFHHQHRHHSQHQQRRQCQPSSPPPPPHYLIVKPVARSEGKGIFLTARVEDLSDAHERVAQTYLQDPLLIDGFKFDVRLFVLITSCNPLRILLHRDGLLRLCTKKYRAPAAENLGQRTMHLTNTAINRRSDNYVREGEKDDGTEAASGSSKRSLRWFLRWLADEHGPESAEALLGSIEDLAIKTIIAIQPSLANTYRACFSSHRTPPSPLRCFEVLGFDVLIDRQLRPWLLEVNHSPSFFADTALDRAVKDAVVSDTLRILNISPMEKQWHMQHHQMMAQVRLYGDNSSTTTTTSMSCDSRGRCHATAATANKVKRQVHARHVWDRYREKEQANGGGFRLIYPQVEPEDLAEYERQAEEGGEQGSYTGTTSSGTAHDHIHHHRRRLARQLLYNHLLEAAVEVVGRSSSSSSSSTSSRASGTISGPRQKKSSDAAVMQDVLPTLLSGGADPYYQHHYRHHQAPPSSSSSASSSSSLSWKEGPETNEREPAAEAAPRGGDTTTTTTSSSWARKDDITATASTSASRSRSLFRLLMRSGASLSSPSPLRHILPRASARTRSGWWQQHHHHRLHHNKGADDGRGGINKCSSFSSSCTTTKPPSSSSSSSSCVHAAT